MYDMHPSPIENKSGFGEALRSIKALILSRQNLLKDNNGKFLSLKDSENKSLL